MALDTANPDHLLALAETLRHEARFYRLVIEPSTHVALLDGATADFGKDEP